MKDIAMAKEAGVTDVWAKYGVAQDRAEYALLRKVTHWRSEQVSKEQSLSEADVRPTFTLQGSFRELLDLFTFVPFGRSDVHSWDALSEKRVEMVIDIWKTTVAVQQHFNDLELRIRNYAITVLAAVVGVAAYSIKENLEIAVSGHGIPVGSVVLLSGIIPWMAFYLMDRWWYHMLLYGAVQHGMRVERSLASILPDIDLTASIGKSSSIHLGKKAIHSKTKMDVFYFAIAVLLLFLAILTWGVVRPVVPSAGKVGCSGTERDAGQREDGKPQGGDKARFTFGEWVERQGDSSKGTTAQPQQTEEQGAKKTDEQSKGLKK
jgi:hypothetical protein